jgi:hypothetical protein
MYGEGRVICMVEIWNSLAVSQLKNATASCPAAQAFPATGGTVFTKNKPEAWGFRLEIKKYCVMIQKRNIRKRGTEYECYRV